MKLNRLLLILLFSSAVFFTSYGSDNYVNKIEFQIYSLNNKQYTNKSFNNIVILHFGNLESNIFIFDFLKLSSFAKTKKYNFHYLPILYNTKDEIEQFKSTYHVDIDIFIDKKDTLKTNIPLQLLPTTYVLDQNGSIIFEYTGALDIDLLDKNLTSLDNFKNGGI